MFKGLFVAIFAFALSISAQAQTPTVQSNTVPTDLLAATVSVLPGADAAHVTVSVELQQVSASNGVETATDVVQSSNDVVTFSGGGTTITYDPTNQTGSNILPYAVDGGYSFTFTRFNGETYTGNVIMPATAAVSAPTPSQVFQKTDVVNAAWSLVASQLLLPMITTACQDTTGTIVYNANYTAAQIPAGYASGCTGTVGMELDVMNANAGTGFGSIVAISDAVVQFSYTDPSTTSPAVLSGVKLSRPDYRKIARQLGDMRHTGLSRAVIQAAISRD